MQRQIRKGVRRARNGDRCLQDVCQGILFFENFPVAVANICTEKFQSRATAGNIMESSLLSESLCRSERMDLFPSLFQSKLMKLMWCCCPVFTQHHWKVNLCVCARTRVHVHESAAADGSEGGNPKSKFLSPTVHIPTVHKKTGHQQ